MELLGGVGHVESCFGPFGGGTSIGARYVHGYVGQKLFWTLPMVLLGYVGHVESSFGPC